VTIAVAVADSYAAEPRGLGIIPNDVNVLRSLVKKPERASELCICYEAVLGGRILSRGYSLRPQKFRYSVRSASQTALARYVRAFTADPARASERIDRASKTLRFFARSAVDISGAFGGRHFT
jgi:hypothetical protein